MCIRDSREYNSKTAILQYFIDRPANRLLSLDGTNLDSLISRKHTFSLLCLTSTNGLVASNSRLTFKSKSTRRAFEHHRRIYVYVRTRIKSLDKLLHRTTFCFCFVLIVRRSLRRCFGRSKLVRLARPTERFKPVKPFTSTCRHILYLTLSLEAYRESRQKRLAVKHRKHYFGLSLIHI